MNATTEQIGAKVGARLEAKRLDGSSPAALAATLVTQVMGYCPNVKLPELLADVDIRAWQSAEGVSDGQLRRALTEQRRASREVAKSNDEVVAPRRRRNKIAKVSIDNLPPPSEGSGFVPNQSLDLL